jgi:hypothetical protein
MPWNPSYNPRGAGNEQPTIGGGVLVYAPTPTTVPLIGELVVAANYTPSGQGDGHYTPPYVKRCPAGGSFAGIGVCVGGTSLGTKPVAGGLCMVQVEGPATVLFKGHATAGQLLIVSTAALGKGKSSATVVAGKTFGFILQSTTTTTKFAYCYIHMI